MKLSNKYFALGWLTILGTLALTGCSNTPKIPDWQLESKGAMERSVAAYLEGNARIEAAELARARSQLSRTGRADLVAGAELLVRGASKLAFSFGISPLVVGLTVSPDRLIQIRRNRLDGLQVDHTSAYVDHEAVRDETVKARRAFERRGWPTIDVTRRSVEETAAGIVNLLSEKRTRRRGAAW